MGKKERHKNLTMPYLGKSMSINAAIAHKKGLLPLSSITTTILKENGFTYPKVFFHWLCQKGYFRPSEFHHASASKRLIRYYDPKRIRIAAASYHLENLYALYRGKITKEEILNQRKAEYVKAITSGSKIGINRTLELYCIKVDGLVLWSQNTALDPDRSKIIENYGTIKPSHWKNPNRDKILNRVIVFKIIKIKNYL